MTTVLKEVGKFQCICSCHSANSACDCKCLGTKREWPSLSKKCFFCKGTSIKEIGKTTKYEIDGNPTPGFWRKVSEEPCIDCEHGFNLDVTLEKIMEIIQKERINNLKVIYENDMINVFLNSFEKTNIEDYVPYGWGETFLDALCRALLDFKRQKTSVQLQHIEGCADYGQNYCNYLCVQMAEKDKIIALKDIRIKELEKQGEQDKTLSFKDLHLRRLENPEDLLKLTWEEIVEEKRKKYPAIVPFKVLSKFLGDAKVQCCCSNIYEYRQDEVSCRVCSRGFPMRAFHE